MMKKAKKVTKKTKSKNKAEAPAKTDAKASFSLLTIFPDYVQQNLDQSILGRAQKKGIVALEAVDLRAFTDDRHRSVDDTLYGGKAGMLFKTEVLDRALNEELKAVGGRRENLRVLYPSPRGLTLDQGVMDAMAEWLSGGEDTAPRRLSVICGRYEGIDERIVDRWVDFEFSMGDYVLTGGELPALVLADAVTRLLPGVLGNEESSRNDSFKGGLLEHPQYTKPRSFQKQMVPEVLLSGVHTDIESWKLRESLLLTFAFRPDLIREHRGQGLPLWARELLTRLQQRLEIREFAEGSVEFSR